MTLGHAGRLFVVRLPHHGVDALDPAAARVVLTGVRRVAAAGSHAAPGELAVLLDPAALPGSADDLGEQVTLVVPLSSGDADFRLAADHGFGAKLEAAGAAVAHVEVRWGSDHDPDAKKAQALDLTRLAAWLHETDRTLLVELVIPGLDAPAGEPRTAELVASVREVRELGIEADLWAVPGPLDADAAQALGELVHDAGRDDVGLLVTHAPGAHDAGFVLGPDIWSDALGRWRDGAVDEDTAATEVADRLRRTIAAAGGSAGA